MESFWALSGLAWSPKASVRQEPALREGGHAVALGRARRQGSQFQVPAWGPEDPGYPVKRPQSPKLCSQRSLLADLWTYTPCPRALTPDLKQPLLL